MKKVICYIVFILISFAIIIAFPKADGCNYKDQAALNKEAKNININYEILTQKLPDGLTTYANGILDSNGQDVTEDYKDYFVGDYVNIIINNITDNFYITINDPLLSESNDNLEYIFYSNTENGTINLKLYNLAEYKKYKFDIYSLNCHTLVKTLTINIPRYNELSALDMCSDIKDYKYCNKYLNNNISTQTMVREINEYKDSLNKSNIKKEEKKINLKIIIIISCICLGVVGLVLSLLRVIKRKREL